MAFHLYEDTWETTTTAGTGPFVLNGAVPRCRPFSAQYANGDTCFYSAYDGMNFEHGLGTYNSVSNTLVRATVYRSTNNNSQVNWSGNPVNVMVAPLGSALEGLLAPGYLFPNNLVADGVTDNTAALAALSAQLGSGGYTVFLPRGIINFSSWSLSGIRNVHFIGVSGQGYEPNTTQLAGTVLQGTRTDALATITGPLEGISFSFVGFQYNSGVYSGNFIDASDIVTNNTNKISFDHFDFHQNVFPRTRTANSFIYAGNVNGLVLSDGAVYDANYGVISATAGDTKVPVTDMTIRDVKFITLNDYAILNPGLGFNADGVDFEPSATNAPAGVKWTGSNTTQGACFTACAFADATAAGSYIVTQSITGLSIHGGSFGGQGATPAIIGITIQGTSVEGLDISGTDFVFLATGISSTSVTSVVRSSAARAAFPGTTTPVSGVYGLGLPLTWTPTDASGAGLVFTSVKVTAQVIGNLMFVNGSLTYPATGDGTNAGVGGLPVASTGSYGAIPGSIANGNSSLIRMDIPGGGTTIRFTTSNGTFLTNTQMSGAAISFSFVVPLS